eukprot:jgi/Mesvir1/15691/Mv03282-RA.1
MDPEHAFLVVHTSFSSVLARLLTPRFRRALEIFSLLNALSLLALLIFMHTSFVGKPGCSALFSGPDMAAAQLVHIKVVKPWLQSHPDLDNASPNGAHAAAAASCHAMDLCSHSSSPHGGGGASSGGAGSTHTGSGSSSPGGTEGDRSQGATIMGGAFGSVTDGGGSGSERREDKASRGSGAGMAGGDVEGRTFEGREGRGNSESREGGAGVGGAGVVPGVGAGGAGVEPSSSEAAGDLRGENKQQVLQQQKWAGDSWTDSWTGGDALSAEAGDASLVGTEAAARGGAGGGGDAEGGASAMHCSIENANNSAHCSIDEVHPTTWPSSSSTLGTGQAAPSHSAGSSAARVAGGGSQGRSPRGPMGAAFLSFVGGWSRRAARLLEAAESMVEEVLLEMQLEMEQLAAQQAAQARAESTKAHHRGAVSSDESQRQGYGVGGVGSSAQYGQSGYGEEGHYGEEAHGYGDYGDYYGRGDDDAGYDIIATVADDVSEPEYIYSVEKGFLLLSEVAKLQHGVRSVNVTIVSDAACLGGSKQRFLLEHLVGYDTVVINSILRARGNRGYLYNVVTKEVYNLNYAQAHDATARESTSLADVLVLKLGVLVTSLFLFFATTMSVSFTLRETQARMFKFTVQLQHAARRRLPTSRLIFTHVVESLIFVPIMIGILFFLFEFFDDQLLAFMVLALVWLCELFVMISARTPVSTRFFPLFFFGYLMAFHIYFFSFSYGFSYLALLVTAAFLQHCVLYFWNAFEVPALTSARRWGTNPAQGPAQNQPPSAHPPQQQASPHQHQHPQQQQQPPYPVGHGPSHSPVSHNPNGPPHSPADMNLSGYSPSHHHPSSLSSHPPSSSSPHQQLQPPHQQQHAHGALLGPHHAHSGLRGSQDHGHGPHSVEGAGALPHTAQFHPQHHPGGASMSQSMPSSSASSASSSSSSHATPQGHLGQRHGAAHGHAANAAHGHAGSVAGSSGGSAGDGPAGVTAGGPPAAATTGGTGNHPSSSGGHSSSSSFSSSLSSSSGWTHHPHHSSSSGSGASPWMLSAATTQHPLPQRIDSSHSQPHALQPQQQPQQQEHAPQPRLPHPPWLQPFYPGHIVQGELQGAPGGGPPSHPMGGHGASSEGQPAAQGGGQGQGSSGQGQGQGHGGHGGQVSASGAFSVPAHRDCDASGPSGNAVGSQGGHVSSSAPFPSLVAGGGFGGGSGLDGGGGGRGEHQFTMPFSWDAAMEPGGFSDGDGGVFDPPAWAQGDGGQVERVIRPPSLPREGEEGSRSRGSHDDEGHRSRGFSFQRLFHLGGGGGRGGSSGSSSGHSSGGSGSSGAGGGTASQGHSRGGPHGASGSNASSPSAHVHGSSGSGHAPAHGHGVVAGHGSGSGGFGSWGGSSSDPGGGGRGPGGSHMAASALHVLSGSMSGSHINISHGGGGGGSGGGGGIPCVWGQPRDRSVWKPHIQPVWECDRTGELVRFAQPRSSFLARGEK